MSAEMIRLIINMNRILNAHLRHGNTKQNSGMIRNNRRYGKMSKIIVAYWTQTGNTLAMAEAIGKQLAAL